MEVGGREPPMILIIKEGMSTDMYTGARRWLVWELDTNRRMAYDSFRIQNAYELIGEVD
jgi:hypothetical protein